MTKDLVYQYIWRDYSLPLRRGWILTLTDNQAIPFLAFVTIAVAFTQVRVWHIVRYVFDRLSRPDIQLLTTTQDELASLSQSEAIKLLFKSQHTRSSVQSNRMRPISRWIGVIALINIILFVTLGILLPWSLSGGLETPVVRSRRTESCIGYEDRGDVFETNAHLADGVYKRCWYNRTESDNPCGRMDGILDDRPQLILSKQSECPFPGDVCQLEHGSVQLEHRNLSLRQFGVNSKSKVLMSHRLTCAPLKMEKFLNVSSSGEETMVAVVNWNSTFVTDIDSWAGYGRNISTVNGPNRYSSELSGFKAFQSKQSYQLHCWPGPSSSSNDNQSTRIEKMHPDLRRYDGTVFVTAFLAGESFYHQPIDDPMFAAHFSPGKLNGYMYFPDYEITGLGCVEQYQFCVPDTLNICTPWGSEWEYLLELMELLSKAGDNDSVQDIRVFQAQFASTDTVQNYLFRRLGPQALVSSQYRTLSLIRYLHPTEQWIIEVKAWFETAFLQARYRVFSVLQRDRPPVEYLNPNTELLELGLKACSQALFYAGNYTNIDFIQLLVTLSSLATLCLLSFEAQIRATANRFGRYCRCKMETIVLYIYDTGVRILRCLRAMKWRKSRVPGVQERRLRPGVYPNSSWRQENGNRSGLPRQETFTLAELQS